MTDQQLADAITAYMQQHKHTTRKKIMTACGTGIERMLRLETAGMVKLPLKLSKKLGAPMGRIAGGWGDRFTIKKTKTL